MYFKNLELKTTISGRFLHKEVYGHACFNSFGLKKIPET